MAKNKIILYLALLLLVVVIFFMARDFFHKETKPIKNPYKYDIQKLKEIDDSLVDYKEIKQIPFEMDTPHGISVDNEDNIYIAGKGKVLQFTKHGELMNTFDIGNEAYCIHVSKNKKIYLGIKNHVEIWSSSGNQKAVWKSYNDTSIITSITTKDTSVFAADAGCKLIHHYDTEGNYIKNIGEKDTAKGIPGFIIPSPYFDVDIGREGKLWATNAGKHKFEAYDGNGNLVTTWAKTSMHLEGFSGCCNPTHFAILDDGAFVTSEKGIERIKIHEPTGQFRCVVAKPSNFEEGTKGLDLDVDSKQRILILDPVKKMVRIFVKNKQ